jgi:mRNA interferase RelE/StbE
MSSRRSRGSKRNAAASSAGGETQQFRLEFLESALREWRDLDGSIKEIFKKQLSARLVNPHLPGSELHGPLAGCYKIKLRSQGYRLVYQVRDDVLVVLVIAIDRRDKDKVYQSALKRIESLLKEPESRAAASTVRKRSTS